MALLFFDGFDHMGTTQSIFLTKWASSASIAKPDTTVVRTGAASLLIATGSSDAISKALPASGGFVVGWAMRATAWTTANDLLQIREGTTVHLAVSHDTTGHLVVKRGTTVLATGTTLLATGTWYYVEFQGTIHDSTGSYELRIDLAPELSATGIDTRNAGTTGQWDRIRLGSPNANMYIDDLYVCDQSGGAPLNTFLGAVKVETLLPQTGNGTSTDLLPSTGTDHGALVDENPPNTTDYNSSATVGHRDTYHYPALALTGTILGVQTNLYVAKSDAAARQVCAVVRSGGTDYDGANVSPTTSFGYFSEVWPADPAGGAWTSTAVNALEAGMKVTV